MREVVRKEETWGEMGPAMRVLTEKQRKFVLALLLDQGKRFGRLKRAAQLAGYVGANLRVTAHDLSRNPKIIEALQEEGRKLIHGGIYADAVVAVRNLVQDAAHRDHARAVGMVIDRVHPLTTHHSVDVVHRHENPDQVALEELKALRQLGATRDKLLELFGPNGLDRIEALEAAEIAQRAAAAKVIDGEAIEATDG
jgi:phage terminase small subunit